jgi:hypothetical protein
MRTRRTDRYWRLLLAAILDVRHPRASLGLRENLEETVAPQLVAAALASRTRFHTLWCSCSRPS